MSDRPATVSRAESPPAAGLARRMACFGYEGVLLFAVLMVCGFVYAALTNQRDAMSGRHGLQAFLFVVLGVYFTWFWSRGGQTVAMKAWRIRLLRADGAPVSQARALSRYLLSWTWFAPALLWAWLGGATRPTVIAIAITVGVFSYAALALLLTDRQFWHDAICGTRLVNWR